MREVCRRAALEVGSAAPAALEVQFVGVEAATAPSLPHQRANVDQVPLPFVKTTWRCRLKQAVES